ncbi:O-methyltransferase [Spartinivicinus poritis]|uniref:Methyltransferase domain-containing protein n=1 Tax=Spartinivicinus poritis TaxID=2994640 RepID=A0ABT5U825_9GAMM|nr:methyltransferase domain-containing protein [Spartinivicinus sp. A2-2]MDE1462521.1 methyltransferase domain-containing protein [Spartinivicinus sp. A2-2]
MLENNKQKYNFDLSDFNKSYSDTVLDKVREETEKLGFEMCSDQTMGALLRFLVSTKPGGNFLELGTGTGAATSWILDGMDENSKLITIDSDKFCIEAAKRALPNTSSIEFVNDDALEFLKAQSAKSFDLIFADAEPGKYFYLNETLELLKPGGMFIVDDMLPQSDWPEDHFPYAMQALSNLKSVTTTHTVSLDCSTGLIMMSPK